MSDTKIRVLVYGAGAIGTYLGGSLALAGHQPVFLERPAAAEKLHKNGLNLVIDGVPHPLRSPQVVDSLGRALANGPFDVVLFALKSFDTRAAAANMAGARESFPPVLCLQNGVDNEPLLAEALGEDRVISGTVTSAIRREGVGHIVLERRRGVGIAGGHMLAGRIAAALGEAGLNPRLYPDALAMKWSKLITNLLTNASAAILDMTPAEVLANPDLFRMETLQLREALAVMDVQGIPVTDLPGTPVRALALAVRYLPPGFSRPLLARAVGRGRGGKMPSLHIDLHGGRGESEVGYLNGAVARHGNQQGIATPVNTRLTDILQRLVRGELSGEVYSHNPQALLEAVFGSAHTSRAGE